MRHQKKGKKIGRNSATRKALLKSLSGDFATHEKIQTTHVKAKMLSSHFERLITKAKKGDLIAIRYLKKYLPTEVNIKKMIDDIAPRYKDRNGGYTRVTKIGPRLGDGASISQIELI